MYVNIYCCLTEIKENMKRYDKQKDIHNYNNTRNKYKEERKENSGRRNEFHKICFRLSDRKRNTEIRNELNVFSL